MKTLTREDIAAALARKLDIPRTESRDLVGHLIEILGDTLASGEPVKLSGFGTFQVVRRAARKGRNLKTGDTVEIPDRKKVAFKASQRLKEGVMRARSSPRPKD